MRYLLALLLTFGAGQAITMAAHAQPVMLEAQPLLAEPEGTGSFAPPSLAPTSAAPGTLPSETHAPAEAAPDTLAAPTTTAPATPQTDDAQNNVPNLSPDDVKQHNYGFTAPTTAIPGQSTISPRHEPWAKPDDRAERARQAQEIFPKLPGEIQNQILTETYEAHRQCNVYGTYAQFHDCDCVGSVFFDERVLDPESSKDAIIARIARHCVSLPGAAAYGYSQCHAGMRFVLVPQRADDYCKCYALEFGKNYQRSPYPDFDNIRALGKLTNSYCIRNVPQAFKNQIRR